MKKIILIFALLFSQNAFANPPINQQIKAVEKKLKEYKVCRDKIHSLSKKEATNCLLKGDEVLMAYINISYAMHENLVYLSGAPRYTDGPQRTLWQ